jgi:bile acid:Na+ symporter, BASS family
MKFVLQFLKDWTLPIAIVSGTVFYKFFSLLAPITPYLIFCMLLVTFCKLSPRKIRLSRIHIWLVTIQIFGCIIVYLSFYKFSPLIAQGAMICILAPTATSAPVITGILGGSVASITTYTLISNLIIALLAPIIFSFVGAHNGLLFLYSFLQIGRKVGPILILPLFVAWGMQLFTPRIHKKIVSFHLLSFYLWAFALMIVMGKTVSFLINQENPDIGTELLIALASLIICILQFIVGRKIGNKYHKTIAGGQSLMQKNTILSIWMAQVFLNPISSIGPASYVVWQNTVNSWQLWKRRKLNESEIYEKTIHE